MTEETETGYVLARRVGHEAVVGTDVVAQASEEVGTREVIPVVDAYDPFQAMSRRTDEEQLRREAVVEEQRQAQTLEILGRGDAVEVEYQEVALAHQALLLAVGEHSREGGSREVEQLEVAGILLRHALGQLLSESLRSHLGSGTGYVLVYVAQGDATRRTVLRASTVAVHIATLVNRKHRCRDSVHVF